MSATTETERDAPFRAAYKCVMKSIRSGLPFERTEAYIETHAGLEREERALLWIVAWAGGAPAAVAAELGRRDRATWDGVPTPVLVRGV